jgi:phage tail-like protein
VRTQEPFTSHRFKVEVEGIEASGALAVILPEARIVAGSSGSAPKLECGSLIVTRGQTLSSDWYEWWNEARSSTSDSGRSVIVVLLDSAGTEALRWMYSGARPIAYRVSALHALESGLLAESLEIAVRTFDAAFGPEAIVTKQRRRRTTPQGRALPSPSKD